MIIETNAGLEYTHYAFRTSKGVFTLIGTYTSGSGRGSKTIDIFKRITEATEEEPRYFDWDRKTIFEWLKQGNITHIPESTTVIWYQNQK